MAKINFELEKNDLEVIKKLQKNMEFLYRT